MYIRAETTNIKDVEVRVVATMTIEEWKILLANLPNAKPHSLYQFAAAIESAVFKVEHNMETEDIKE